jgi:hypothetical protein
VGNLLVIRHSSFFLAGVSPARSAEGLPTAGNAGIMDWDVFPPATHVMSDE